MFFEVELLGQRICRHLISVDILKLPSVEVAPLYLSINNVWTGNSLVVQSLRLFAFIAGWSGQEKKNQQCVDSVNSTTFLPWLLPTELVVKLLHLCLSDEQKSVSLLC